MAKAAQLVVRFRIMAANANAIFFFILYLRGAVEAVFQILENFFMTRFTCLDAEKFFGILVNVDRIRMKAQARKALKNPSYDSNKRRNIMPEMPFQRQSHRGGRLGPPG
ncbi:hypothetical protein ACFL9U_16190 [Thermodesulfobacteriota bacterium]